MDEQAIAEKQKANIPTQDPAPQPTEQPELVNTDQQTMQTDAPLEPLAGYKLADVLRIQYEPNDTEQAERLEYIYKEAAQLSGSAEYIDVAKHIRSLVEMLGAQSSQDPLYTVYQWMKLDSTRKKVEQEMQLYANRG